MANIVSQFVRTVRTGIQQAWWGLWIDRPSVARRARKAYNNTLFWYDGATPPGPNSSDVERYAYSERQHWRAVMDALDIPYDDLDANVRLPSGPGGDDGGDGNSETDGEQNSSSNL